MPTMTTESKALPKASPGIRPAWNQIAAVVLMPLPLDRCFRTICPAPVTRPAPSSTRMCRHAPACWGGAQQVGVGAASHRVLHRLEQPGQCRGDRACADTSEEDRQPEEGGARMAKRRRYPVNVGRLRHVRRRQCHL